MDILFYLHTSFFPQIEHSYNLLNKSSFQSFNLFLQLGWGGSKKRGILLDNWQLGQSLPGRGEYLCKWRIQLESTFNCNSL